MQINSAFARGLHKVTSLCPIVGIRRKPKEGGKKRKLFF